MDGGELALLVGHKSGPNWDDPDTSPGPLQGGVTDGKGGEPVASTGAVMEFAGS
jgi:hypothetical protein